MRAGWLLAAALLVGCDSLLTKPTLYNTVDATVTRRDGTPIDDMPLVLYTGARPMAYGSTDANGRFTFQRVPEGLYGVRVIPSAGFVGIEDVIGGRITTAIDGLTLTHDTTASVAFTLLRVGSGTLTAQVSDAAKRPLAGVPVELYNSQRVEARAVTDANGVATFANAAFGNHGIRVIRPKLYRDFNTPNDSLYSFRDALVVDSGSTQTVSFPITRCAGTVVTRIVDQNGAPVPLTTAALYDSEERLGLAASDAAGTITFSDLPCAYFLAVNINPPVGYSVGEGRGLNFIDGIRVTNGATVTVTFTVRKN